MFIPLLETIDIENKDITADALLPQRKLADYLDGRQAHYHFTVKGNQPTPQADITRLFQNRQAPDLTLVSPPDHGRIEARRLWCSTALNAYLDFPHVGQAFLIEREVLHKKTGKRTCETARGITSEYLQKEGCTAAPLRHQHPSSLLGRQNQHRRNHAPSHPKHPLALRLSANDQKLHRPCLRLTPV
ncbi:hypothetical protein [Accumulibacter sp.]|uniref:hypothetical protein n=1 Tax=Accumulibacter sp. TaxID=2053492 RepID=UPI0025DF60A5|nr:hypothetical protein [Accumulibacter sp.]MCM8625134.1 hypothetical protein [Accumulibacter sp.]